MQDVSFKQLADEAAAGVRADGEVYLEVTEELRSFLEDKAGRYRREGHSEEESIELAKKAFGSPLDVAAELRKANLARMRLRAVFRIAFGTLLVPVIIFFALCIGYGRLVRVQAMMGRLTDTSFELPFHEYFTVFPDRDTTLIRQLSGSRTRFDGIKDYWLAHRQEPGSERFYAYYALFAPMDKERQYVEDLRAGERLEPDNALYNVLLAEYYLSKGVLTFDESQRFAPYSQQPPADRVLDQRLFTLGMAELKKAVAKPYLHTYQMDMLRMKLNSLPRPLLTEEYIYRITLMASDLFPQLTRYRELGLDISSSARILYREGQPQAAEALMDTWQPYTRLLTGDNNSFLVNSLVSLGVAEQLSKDAAEVYEHTGDGLKAQATREIAQQVHAVRPAWKRDFWSNSQFDATIRRHGSAFVGVILPNLPSSSMPAIRELKASRMHEHALYEEGFMQGLQALLVLLLLGTVIQGWIWLFRLRGAASVPLLLVPPVKVTARALWWGLALPLLVYFVYSRLPVIGGRDYSWAFQGWRFAIELSVLSLLALWLPARMIRRYVRRRCNDLSIALPSTRDERLATVILAVAVTLTVILTVITFEIMEDGRFSAWFSVAGIILALAVITTGVQYAAKKRQPFALYFGTLARSMAPVYAFSVLFLALIVQPWLLANEAYWLRKDTLLFGYVGNPHSNPAGLTRVETQAAEGLSREIVGALARR